MRDPSSTKCYLPGEYWSISKTAVILIASDPYCCYFPWNHYNQTHVQPSCLQLYVNEAPINYTNAATDKGVIHGLGKVLEVQKNRCDNNDTTIVRVSYIQGQ